MTTSRTTIPIGELSQRTGCNIETIRYYERISLLPVPLRRGRYRAYGPSDVRRLSFVRRARELGFPIDSVRALLALADGGAASCAQARDLASEHLRDVRVKIADLRRMEQVLGDTVAACEADDTVSCPLLETLCTSEAR
ncbi:helix-turn-helix domain-containing protein [Sphingobium scionense]|jgi:MerR family mercuric resistance operon transcriptional regulator|uniref:MerR family mercuric resistance operon transcriptional regulator n=1 Tax=Sphingobium scionense TaxID=1404341 RepID=A0A7W6LW77_9SPHN|nr:MULTISPECIES: helix-turn-helix domain-containing protein [Sphingomonadaceae]MBB4151277.1 MerR family mercuric resistance operon transcriptional regulator [Sphingobium scionense]MCF8709283.1 helix-turn-helix domain-containing protein [Rhizorhapis sp. SPR117]MCM3681480.1 helix-turn-helix domain-containing protein [Sphingomonas paucimobilis]|tara:strand:+ start:21193 stop:21609 length:417 start_codon:yes stop_codon:yes gene_type:complete